MAHCVGLDVGGAHLKIAVVDTESGGPGRVSKVKQIICPLWQGMDSLQAALDVAEPLILPGSIIGVTMTGELSDLFADRAIGVTTLVDTLTDRLGPGLHFWLGAQGFGTADAACANPTDVGSTNFLASAVFAAKRVPDGVLIDFGSTTADIIPFQNGVAVPIGLTDGARLTSGELVYTGLTRTAVMGVATRAPFQGQWQTLAREQLANMADVRRVLSELPAGVDVHQTADGRSKSLDHSLARFARMFGRDRAEGSLGDWRQSAAVIREAQVRSIQGGLQLVLSRTSLPASAPIIAAGIGCDTARILAQRAGRPAIDFATLAATEPSCAQAATHAAPAVAIAHLVMDQVST